MLLFILTTLHIITCLFLILVVLLQQGKGADLSVFGGGSTQAVFGARGAATLLHKLTVFAFVSFIVTTIGIGFLRSGSGSASVMTDVTEEEQATESEAAAPGEGAAPPEADDALPLEEEPVLDAGAAEPADAGASEEDGGESG